MTTDASYKGHKHVRKLSGMRIIRLPPARDKQCTQRRVGSRRHRAILETSRPMDYSFAGRADFIRIEEVLQLLGSGNYSGMLGIEKVPVT